MGFSTMEGTSDSRVEDIYGNSKYGSSSLQTIEMHSEVRKGIKLLKRSIACVSSYGYSHLLVPVPFNMSTFQMLTELLFMLSSKDVNFVGYTYKNLEIVQNAQVPGFGMCFYRSSFLNMHAITYI